RPGVPRPGRRHPARHRAAHDAGRVLRVGAGPALPDELRRRAEARGGAGGSPARDQAQAGTGAARDRQRRHRPRRHGPPRPVRSAVAGPAGPVRRSPRRHLERRRRPPMSVTDITKDPVALTMTVTAEYDAPVERAWQLWADPRLLERWWGPPTYPATFVDHDLSPGGHVGYYMTGPAGDKPHGWWRITAVDAPRRLEFEDGFADRSGGGTRMVIVTTFPSAEAMEQLIAMGMEEGLSGAMGQIDALL